MLRTVPESSISRSNLGFFKRAFFLEFILKKEFISGLKIDASIVCIGTIEPVKSLSALAHSRPSMHSFSLSLRTPFLNPCSLDKPSEKTPD
jgi:hypothetical protein